MQTFRDLVWLCPQCTSSVCQAVVGCEENIQENEGKQALIWLLGMHGELIPNAPYILEDYADNVKAEVSPPVKMELLTALVRLFLSRPAECQDTLGRLLYYCIEEETNMAVRDRGLFYYRLLSSGISEVKKVLCGAKSDASLGVLADRTEQPVNSWVPLFNTLTPLYDEKLWESIVANSGKCELPIASNPAARSLVEAFHTSLDCARSPEPPDAITLLRDVAMTPEEFERKWLCLPIDHCWDTDWKKDVEPDLLQSSLHVLIIYTIAKSRAGTQPWKSYLYAQDGKESVYLVEVMLCTGSWSLRTTVKQDGENQVTLNAFVSHLQHAVSAVL
ncbi:Beta2-adaptin appendage, partial [Pristimantis euphronides]